MQDQIEAEVKILLSLKGEYKSVTGIDWKPPAAGSNPSASQKAKSPPSKMADAPAACTNPAAEELNNKITVQGNKVRELKANKAAKVSKLFLVTDIFFLSSIFSSFPLGLLFLL